MDALLLTSDLAISSAVTGAAQRQGIRFASAFTPAALLDKLAETTAALVIIDLSTPGLDIEAFVTQLRGQVSDLQIVAFGPHVHEQRLAAAREAGCDDVYSRGQFHRGMDEILAKSS